MSPQTTIGKKVQFIDSFIKSAEQNGVGFTSDYFIYIIDKFFSASSNYVCLETDGEYRKFLEQEKRELEAVEKAGDELDDYFFLPTDEEKEEVEGVMQDDANLTPPVDEKEKFIQMTTMAL
jgi:hypothetical protein